MANMSPMGRPLCAAACSVVIAIALLPLTASAAAPTPSPSLETVLAAPPATDFSELTTSPLRGKFTAHDWASLASNASQAAQTEATLNRDGFVDGFARTWAQVSSGHGLIETVMAFTGGRGARDALRAMEQGDKSDSSYTKADSVSGLGTYYGAHFVDKSNQVIEDSFGFVKGNDVFGIAFLSTKDDVLDVATKQAQSQYQSAPDSTIPSSQWPENSTSAAYRAGYALGIVLPVIFVIAVVGLVVGLVVRRSRRSAMPAYATIPGTGGPAGGVQMSPDGNYWWDGQVWRDAAHEFPPGAQLSSDGTLWWDGRTWRPVPQSNQPEPPPTS